MNCDECKKNKASVHITKIINNQKKEINLCQECANKVEEFQTFPGEFSLPNILAGFFNFSSPKQEMIYTQSLKCKKCGTNLISGKFGCSECYNRLGDSGKVIFKRLHGASRHTGKLPNRAGSSLKLKREIQNLKSQLQKAIYEENFEEAAKLRDSIKQHENFRGE
jgi:protein arginine kinase activator